MTVWPEITQNVAKIEIILHEIDAMEKEGYVRFWTRSRNTAISAHAQQTRGQRNFDERPHHSGGVFMGYNVVFNG